MSLKGNLTLSIGIISIIVGILSIPYSYRNKDNIPNRLLGLKKDKFLIKDKENFKKIMFIKNITLSMSLILLGVFISLTKDNAYILIFPMIINSFFDKYSMKYVLLYN